MNCLGVRSKNRRMSRASLDGASLDRLARPEGEMGSARAFSKDSSALASPGGIESHVGRMVEKFGQHLRFQRQDAGVRLDDKRPDCAHFHAEM